MYSSRDTEFAKCSFGSNPYNQYYDTSFGYNPYNQYESAGYSANPHNQYAQYNSQMKNQQMAQPAWAFSLDDYTDDSDSDGESLQATPVAKAAVHKPTSVHKIEKQEETITSPSFSPRSNGHSTCEPDSDAFSSGSDSEDGGQRRALDSKVVSEDSSQPSDSEGASDSEDSSTQSVPAANEVADYSHCLFSVASLLKTRHSVSWIEGIEDLTVKAEEDKAAYKFEPELDCKKAPTKSSKRARKARSSKKKDTLNGNDLAHVLRRALDDTPSDLKGMLVSDDSWQAQQIARRKQSAEEADAISDEDVMRAIKSILNKLTIEKFTPLYQKLVSCGIQTRAHVNVLMDEVFEKAAAQHNFINMYADLCTLLRSHFHEHPVTDDADMSFESVLLNAHIMCAQSCSKFPEDLTSLDDDDRREVECKRKTKILGNMKFLGALLVRQLLDSKVMLDTFQELLSESTPESLELLVAFLSVVGPKFDTRESKMRNRLNQIFNQVQELIRAPQMNRRVCFLIKDLLELRAARWMDQKPKVAEGPSTLKEVAAAQAAEESPASSSRNRPQKQTTGGSSWSKSEKDDDECFFGRRCTWAGCRYKHSDGRDMDEVQVSPWAPVDMPQPKEMTQDVQVPPASPSECSTCGSDTSKKTKVKRRYRKHVCRKEVAEALAQLRTTQDVKEAMRCIKAIGVPASKQADEFCDMLGHMMKEPSKAIRKVFFDMVLSLFVEDIWSQSALTSGLENLLENVCPKLECEVPGLSGILWEELHPVIAPLVSSAIAK